MMKKNKKLDFKKIKGILPYIVTGVLTLGIVFVGSLDKQTSNNVSLDSFANSGYNVSVDQISELYVVADLSDALGLASAENVAANYVMSTSIYESGQTSIGKLEKPNLTDAGSREWVIEHVVQEDETMDDIADKYGITTDQIRWSNGLKTTTVSAGTTLYIPKESGIVYTVKSDDSIESIASKYGSTVEEITIFNDLDIEGLSEGMRIYIKDGTLPNTERPEYVAPVVARRTYSYVYLGDTSERRNIRDGYFFYGAGGGQCVNWALYKRPDLKDKGLRGWAREFDNVAYTLDGVSVSVGVPVAGSIFQTDGGSYAGHVGYVESINEDGSITVTEMNYRYRAYFVTRSEIPADKVGNFKYIY